MTPLEHGIFQAINRRRARDGLSVLLPDPALIVAGREHSAAMARLGFFDHTSPVRGRETPALRAGTANAEFVAIGENLAVLSPQIATAEGFLRGWLDSPPHRENLLKANWEWSGVGVHATRSRVHATQLFSISPDVRLEAPEFVGRGHPLLSLRGSFDLEGRGEVGLLVEGACLAGAVSDPRGQAAVEALLPAAWARGDVAFALRSSPGAGPWKELVSGRVDGRGTGRWEWMHARGPFPGVREWNVDVSREPARAHHLWLRGEARRPSSVIVVMDDYVQQTIEADGRFVLLQQFKPQRGEREVNVGVRKHGYSYQPVRGFRLDMERGTVWEQPLSG